MADVTWPRKTREFHNHHFDSTVWNNFRFRDDDIFIATYAKTGTTWTQQIVAQLLFADADDLPVADMSPWLDLRVPPNDVKLAALEAQKHRRFIKTHLPLDALVYSPKGKYIYVARDGRDVVWSMYNHHVQRKRAVVPTAQRYARARRAADRASRRHRSGNISSTGWTATASPFWSVLGEYCL